MLDGELNNKSTLNVHFFKKQIKCVLFLVVILMLPDFSYILESKSEMGPVECILRHMFKC